MNFEFSNFDAFQYPLIYQGIKFLTVENFFQAMKAEENDLTTRKRISILPPGSARKAGRRLKLRDDWEDIKLRVMRYGLRYKFAPYTSWANQLLATGNTEIIEWNTWHDCYWGKCRCDKCGGDVATLAWRGIILVSYSWASENS